MRIKVMDDVEKKIENIKNLEAVFYYDISASSNNKLTIIPSIMIIYDGEKVLFLSTQDKHFDIFYKKIREVYQEEKNRVREDERTDPFHLRTKIKIDEFTDKILCQGTLDETSSLYQQDKYTSPYDKSLFFSSDDLQNIFPIMKYHLKKILGLFNKVVTLTDDIKGYNNTYAMNLLIDGKPTIVPVVVLKKDFDSYSFIVGGVLEKAMPIHFDIAFLSDGIKISLRIDELSFYDNYLYQTKESKMIVSHQTILNNEVQILETVDLETCENPFQNLEEDGYIWYSLPWNALYGINHYRNNINETESVLHSKNTYLQVVNDNYLIYRFFAKKYQRRATATVTIRDLLIDSMSLKEIGLKKDDYYLIETSFGVNGANGYFKEHLAGKYFYHLALCTNIDEITDEKLITITSDKNFFDKVDLLKKGKVYHLIDGVKKNGNI